MEEIAFATVREFQRLAEEYPQLLPRNEDLKSFQRPWCVDRLLKHDVGQILIYDNFVRGRYENLQGALADPRVKIFDVGGVVTWGSTSSGLTNIPAVLTNTAVAVAGGDSSSLALRTSAGMSLPIICAITGRPVGLLVMESRIHFSGRESP